MLSTSLVKNTTKKTANNTNLTPTRCRPTADAAQVLAMDPVFPGIYKVQSSAISKEEVTQTIKPSVLVCTWLMCNSNSILLLLIKIVAVSGFTTSHICRGIVINTKFSRTKSMQQIKV